MSKPFGMPNLLSLFVHKVDFRLGLLLDSQLGIQLNHNLPPQLNLLIQRSCVKCFYLELRYANVHWRRLKYLSSTISQPNTKSRTVTPPLQIANRDPPHRGKNKSPKEQRFQTNFTKRFIVFSKHILNTYS